MQHYQSYTDMMGNTVQIPHMPKRIVSLVPSQTELLYDLGLDEHIVGQTRFCIHPAEKHKSKPRVGGTKDIKLDIIRSLKPDLIIGNKEENERESIEELMREFPVWMSDIHTLDDALTMIEQVGTITATSDIAQGLVHEIRLSFQHINSLERPIPTAYFIWRKPWMVAAHDTFINHMLERIGLINVFNSEESRYPEVGGSAISYCGAKLILLSSEPYPFAEKHIAELQQLVPQAHIQLVDGELFSWYGSRLRKSASYFATLQRQFLHWC